MVERARRSWHLWRGALAVVIVVGSAAAVLALVQDGGDREEARTGPLEEVFPARDAPAIAWTGDRLLLVGGHIDRPDFAPPHLLSDAALVDVDTGITTALPPAPFDPPLYHPRAIVVGDTAVVVGVRCGSMQDDDGPDWYCEPGDLAAATVELSTGRWQLVDAPSGGAILPLGATSDGRPVFRVGRGPDGDVYTDPTFVMFDPTTASWSELPTAGTVDDICLVGDRLKVLTSDYVYDGTRRDLNPFYHPQAGQTVHGPIPGDGYVGLTVRELLLTEPGAAWRDGEPSPGQAIVSDFGRPVLKCVGDDAYAFVGSARLRFDSSGWTPLPDVERDVATGVFAALPAGEVLVLSRFVASGAPPSVSIRPQAVRYDPATNEGSDIVGVPVPTPDGSLWTGASVVGYAPDEPDDGADPTARRTTGASVYRYVP